MTAFPNIRLRRLRQHPQLRRLVRETELSINDLVLPLFIHHESSLKKAIAAMPGHYQLGVDHLAKELEQVVKLGIPAVLLFGIPETKDALGSDAYSDQGVIQTAIKKIKQQAPDLLVISDLCFCEYTDHGHCGLVQSCGAQPYTIDNDATLELLAKQAVSHAQAGADVIAPSGMMDGMVQAIRIGLDQAGFTHIPILSYAAKYCSALYGPFREAAEGAPQFGDRQTYQMDPANGQEALREVALDVQEGADMLMVKPAHTYLDIICRVKSEHPNIPLAAYHVSGEFAMLKAAAANGWLDEKKAALEVLSSIKRAGADFIITYYAKEAALWL
jgi:porphobilinogen synthase